MKKLLALLLSALFVLSIFTFTACGGEEKESEQLSEGSDSGISTEVLTDAEGNLLDGIPDGKYNFNEREFIITTPYPAQYGTDNYDQQELTSNTVYDEIYYRNRNIENRFNCKISALEVGKTDTYVADISPLILSDAGAFTIMSFAYSTSSQGLISAGLIAPWNDVPVIDYSKPWWNDSAIKAATLNGKLFFNAGAFNWYSIAMTKAVFFNEEIRVANNMPNFYELVDNGEWTMDKLIEFCRIVAKDDGNGTWNAQDTYGFVGNGIDNLAYGFGFETVINHGDGTYTINIGNESHHKMLNKLIDLLKRENHIAYNNSDHTPFVENRSLFYTMYLYDINKLRVMETDFGILPYAKLDASQDRYYSFSQAWGLANAIPINTKPEDYEFIGVVLEALSCYSYNKILPAYYDYTLKGRDTRDTDSWRMLDLINSSLIYDFGYFFFCGTSEKPVTHALGYMMRYGREKNELASYLETHLDELTAHYDSVMEFGK
ncbi:MAG: hypothetical protein E7623_05650 [Ruminococcaceae bacterium]|nr:hypothetical protein [Oscillospiraceae bacterium]